MRKSDTGVDSQGSQVRGHHYFLLSLLFVGLEAVYIHDVRTRPIILCLSDIT